MAQVGPPITNTSLGSHQNGEIKETRRRKNIERTSTSSSKKRAIKTICVDRKGIKAESCRSWIEKIGVKEKRNIIGNATDRRSRKRKIRVIFKRTES